MIKENQAPAQTPDEPRIGIFVCRCGGNISDVVDVEKVCATMEGVNGVVTAKVNTFMCSDPGQSLIADEIKDKKLNRVVVASCSPFLHELTFRTAVKRGGLNAFLYEHVNIREQASWAHHSDPAGATEKAMRMIAAAVGKVRHAEPLDTIRLSNHRQALVIGGGIAGLKAAADLAGKGIPVILIERSGALGGRVASLGKVFPTETDARQLVGKLVDRVKGSPLIKVYLRSQLSGVSGFLGNFDIAIKTESDPSTRFPTPGAGNGAEPGIPKSAETSASVGAIILATGFDPYTPSQGEFGYGSAQVVTMPDFVAATRAGAGADLVWNGRPVRSVGFMHCVGSRQIEGVHAPQADGKVNDYCSRTCCTAILQQAAAVKTRYPRVHVYDFHQDIRTYGRGHEDYYRAASDAGVTFLRYHGDEPPIVESSKDGEPLKVTLKDWLTFGEEVEVGVDLLVLGVGMVPRRIADLVDLLKLPIGADRFVQEVHPKLRPVEVSVNGVLLAGTAQGPMNIEETLCAASAAASKAATLLGREFVELDPFVAHVNPELCTGCEACLPECAYPGALTCDNPPDDDRDHAVCHVNPGLCVGCGACVAVCPTRAIDLKGWTLSQFDAMVDGLVADLPVLAGAEGQ